MDLSFDRALKKTINSPHFTVQPDVPLSLLPDITPGIMQTISHHGAILQLPPKPQIFRIQVAANIISLEWKVQDQNTDVSSDRTLTFSLHCYGDIPYKLKRKLTFRKRRTKIITPESGFEEMSELSSESKNTFPSLPASLLGSRNISLMMQVDREQVSNGSKEMDHLIEDSEGLSSAGILLKPTGSKNIASLLPEPIRLPQKKDDQTKTPVRLSDTNPSNSGGVLNLPPLVISGKQDQTPHQESMQSVQSM